METGSVDVKLDGWAKPVAVSVEAWLARQPAGALCTDTTTADVQDVYNMLNGAYSKSKAVAVIELWFGFRDDDNKLRDVHGRLKDVPMHVSPKEADRVRGPLAVKLPVHLKDSSKDAREKWMQEHVAVLTKHLSTHTADKKKQWGLIDGKEPKPALLRFQPAKAEPAPAQREAALTALGEMIVVVLRAMAKEPNAFKPEMKGVLNRTQESFADWASPGLLDAQRDLARRLRVTIPVPAAPAGGAGRGGRGARASPGTRAPVPGSSPKQGVRAGAGAGAGAVAGAGDNWGQGQCASVVRV